ncbi:integrative conjugative element protein, RAQPRD family [Pseudomonas mediterranea]|uniref:Integrative conjugative element protein, RAQPRD family n=1 Tax=Pseudomonas mediterranea TaxID=183795 RepID=A0AAX2DFH6_9PSED|nr:RAQPRD family integrative conjugative element protein [Pseudomonas mediterranea]SDU66827.1 integrative conjugative element protein, RAQPRD family [Pseudomonas mediterranea]
MSNPALRYFFIFSLSIIHDACYAASDNERQQLSLIQQQLDVIEHLATRAETAITAESGERYHFDYSRLIRDIRRIRQGVRGYLLPSRAQPRDLTEVMGVYRLDTPPTEPSP